MKRLLAILASLALGAAATGIVLWLTGSDARDVWEGIALAGWPGLGATFGLIVLQLAAQAWSWQFLTVRKRGGRVRFRVLFEAVVVGWGLNFITPSMYLGGEPIRAYYAAKDGGLTGHQAMATVIVSKYVEFTTFMVFLLASTVILVVSFAADLSGWVLATVIGIDVLLTAVLALLYVSIFRRWGVLVRACDRAARMGLFRRWLTAHRRKVLEVECHVRRAFFKHRRETVKSLAAMGLFTLASSLRPVPFFFFLRGAWPFGVAELAAFYALGQLLQALQFTPGGLGFLEGGYPGIFLLFGVPAPQTLAFVGIHRVADLAFVAIGFALFAHRGLRGVGQAP